MQCDKLPSVNLIFVFICKHASLLSSTTPTVPHYAAQIYRNAHTRTCRTHERTYENDTLVLSQWMLGWGTRLVARITDVSVVLYKRVVWDSIFQGSKSFDWKQNKILHCPSILPVLINFKHTSTVERNINNNDIIV